MCYVVYVSLGKGWQYALYTCYIKAQDRWKHIYSHQRAIHYQHFSRKELLNVFKIVTSQMLSFALILDINEVHDELRV